jgi:hypothetical protein
MNPLLNRSESLFFALSGDDIGQPALHIILTGDFPPVLSRSAISGEGSWDKVYGKVPYWQNRTDGSQVAVPAGGIIFFSPRNIDALIRNYLASPEPRLPEEAEKEFDISDLVVYVNDPGPVLLKDFPVDPETFPMRSLWFSVLALGDGYHVSGVFQLDSNENARRMALLSKLLFVGWIKQYGFADFREIKDTLDIRAEGSKVRLDGLRMDRPGLIAFIQTFIPGGIITP